MKGAQRIFGYLVASYIFWFLLYLCKNVNAPYRKLLFIPMVFSIISAMFFTLFRKSLKKTYRKLFDKNYKYNKPLKKIRS